MTKVYAIHEGCRWEGGSTVAIAQTYEGARIEAERRVAENQIHNKEHYEFIVSEGYDTGLLEIKIWQEEKKDYWSDGMNIVTITEFELLP